MLNNPLLLVTMSKVFVSETLKYKENAITHTKNRDTVVVTGDE